MKNKKLVFSSFLFGKNQGVVFMNDRNEDLGKMRFLMCFWWGRLFRQMCQFIFVVRMLDKSGGEDWKGIFGSYFWDFLGEVDIG